MLDPVTPSLLFLGSAVANGVIGNRIDANFKSQWDKIRNNLQQYRPHANHDLATAAYRAYLQATLQTCAVLLERNNVKVDNWFKLSVLPGAIKKALRSLLVDQPQGLFTLASKQWLEVVSQDHLDRLKKLSQGTLDLPSELDREEFNALLAELDLLMQSAEAHEREQLIRASLADRVLKDLKRFGALPAGFEDLIRERWFEYLCAAFQYAVKYQPEIANAFESLLLAKLVARSDWLQQLTIQAGETFRLVESLQQEQRKGFADLKASIEKLDLNKPVDPEPLIHSLPTRHTFEGRLEESAAILRAMALNEEHVVTFAAPGGFGKSVLLAKVVQQLAPDDKILEQITLTDGETLETNTTAVLHVDCRNDVKLSAIFANTGRLIGQEQLFRNIYNSDGNLPDRVQEIFSRLSRHNRGRTWFLFDNFEPLLNEKGEVANDELDDFFSAFSAGGHNVYALICGREVPQFSRNVPVLVLASVGSSLFDGLPLADCIAYLRNNGADVGLSGTGVQVDAVLAAFATKVHRIPQALVWAVGYLQETDFTLQEILDKQELFANFDQEQAKEAKRYENRGLKRLHYEQLSIQSPTALTILRLLAFFKYPVPKGALAHKLDKVELNKTLTRLERNKLITRKQSSDSYTRYLKEDLGINLYGLHPVICENDFFDTLPDRDALYKAVAYDCWRLAKRAYDVNHFAYAYDLAVCAGKLFEYLRNRPGVTNVLRDYAAMLIAKGEVLRSMRRLPESVAELTRAIALLENVEPQSSLAHDLGTAHLNKGATLYQLTQFPESVTEFEKAIPILKSLFDANKIAANNLALAYINNGEALRVLEKVKEAAAEHDKAITILEPVLQIKHEVNLAKLLALAYLYKGLALFSDDQRVEAVAEYDNAIAILKPLIYDNQETHLFNDLALTHLEKSSALYRMNKLSEAFAENHQAIEILEDLVDAQQQTNLGDSLAESYFTRAQILAGQQNWNEALASYQLSLDKRRFCLEHLKMYWLMPDLLEVLRYRLTTLIELQRWADAAKDLREVLTMYSPYVLSDTTEENLKTAAKKQLKLTIDALHGLPPTTQEMLYAELGADAENIRALASEKN